MYFWSSWTQGRQGNGWKRRIEPSGGKEQQERKMSSGKEREIETVTKMAYTLSQAHTRTHTRTHTHTRNDHFRASLLLLADYPWDPPWLVIAMYELVCVCAQMVLTSRPFQGRWSKWCDYSNDRHTHLSRSSAWLPALLDTHTCAKVLLAGICGVG